MGGVKKILEINKNPGIPRRVSNLHTNDCKNNVMYLCICRYGYIRDTYKDDWNSEDEDLLAEILSDLNFFSAEKRTSASSKGRGGGGKVKIIIIIKKGGESTKEKVEGD